jgi:hypothetical protein
MQAQPNRSARSGYFVALGVAMSIIGAVGVAVGAFSLYAQYAGSADRYRLVLDTGFAWAALLFGLAIAYAGFRIRKRAR